MARRRSVRDERRDASAASGRARQTPPSENFPSAHKQRERCDGAKLRSILSVRQSVYLLSAGGAVIEWGSILNWRGFIIIREKSGTLLSKILFPPSLACEP